jgi:hypothetical protein
MNIKYGVRIALLPLFALAAITCGENFVVKKRKPHNQSMNKLKENYAQELADLVKLVPKLQKQLATLQEDLIEELYKAMDDELSCTKCEIDGLTCKTQELRCFLEQMCENSLPSKSSFLRQRNNNKVCTEPVAKDSKPR